MVEHDDLLDEQLRYYSSRARLYDEAYTRTGHSDRGAEANEQWWAELRVVDTALAESGIAGEVLELGCGTGRWTVELAHLADSVVALDGSAEMLAVAAERLAAFTNVTLEVVDIVRAWQHARTFDAVAAFFFLEHVPDSHIDGLVDKIAASLRPGGTVFLAEGKYREPDHAHHHVEHRELHGHEFQVVERRRTPAEFTALFARHDIAVTVTETDRLFTVVQGTTPSA